MLVQISDIRVRKRVRKDLGDMNSLIDSIKRFGLLNPIVLSPDYELIAGFRRLHAAKQLGWENISATVVDASDKIERLELELEENVQRSNFTEEELLEGYATLERLKHPSFFRRIWNGVQNFFTRAFDRREARKEEKRRINGFLSLLFPLGLILIALSGVFYKKTYISSVLLSLFNILSFIIVVFGLFFLIRFLLGGKKRRN